MVEYVKGSVQENMEESEIYDEAWLFGKALWAIILQKTLGLIFCNERVAKGYQCCFKLVKYFPLSRKGSYFSMPVNGHV